jgi:hypothetical protein
MLITSSGQRHWQNYFRRDLVVTLDGVVQQDVLEADDEAGYVVRIQKDDSGRIKRRHGRLAHRARRGLRRIHRHPYAGRQGRRR